MAEGSGIKHQLLFLHTATSFESFQLLSRNFLRKCCKKNNIFQKNPTKNPDRSAGIIKYMLMLW